MKKISKYFLNNLILAMGIVFIVIGCGFSIFLLFAFIDFVTTMIASPIVGFAVCTVLLIIMLSVLLTLFDMFSNKRG